MTRRSYIDENGDALELDEHFFKNATRGRPPFLPEQRKVKTTIMFDRAVLEHFKKDGKGWQTRINDTLRDVAGLG